MSNDDRNEVKTYFKMNEICRWIGVSPFELLVNLVSFLIFTILLTLAVEGEVEFLLVKLPSNGTHVIDQDNNYRHERTIDWMNLFYVLFCADILNSYFLFIVFFRLFLSNQPCIHRLFWSVNFILLIALFKYLMALKLNGTSLEYTEICSPIFVLLQLFALRACQIKNS